MCTAAAPPHLTLAPLVCLSHTHVQFSPSRAVLSLRRSTMRTFQRAAAVLILPAIAWLGAACERDTPTEARPGGMALSVSGDLTDAVSTDLGQSYQVILSCTDGHSVILWVDSATLSSLAADVEAINASDTGVRCTLDSTALDPSSQTPAWTVYDY